MCVALPGVVLEVKDTEAVVDFSGNRVNARTGLVDVKEGDRVLVHAGCILQTVSQSEAEELESLFSELSEMGRM
ncbi:MAG: HypC/HybG/HupF family hydrogenase formation chaperone [Lachnospiraceae bacterium]|nr:HypC/HybG/HupF family hydrogenase formation chaperone [Lachnospiraceae bacterium]